jgi:low affinity Fe/Cu permease
MAWEQVLTIILANIGVTIVLFLWARTEGNADRRDILSMIKEIKEEVHELKRANDAINIRLNKRS